MKKKIENYIKKKEEISEKLWFKFLNNLFNLILAFATVVPVLYKICTTIPFSFEINDDAVLLQILNGSFTGNPDAHAIFIKYPLSWIIKELYRLNPEISLGIFQYSNVNWYVGAVVLLYGFALVMVLFRALTFFRCNRFLICVLYALGFIKIWLPCFSEFTFSTVAAFLGCMSLAYLALEQKNEVWRPWNLIILGALMTASYSMRPSCFYMVIPFLVVEFIIKYNIDFIRSWKPWFSVCVIALMCAGVLYVNHEAYDSQSWQNYFTYNHERAYMQDYVGFPEYDENKEFYQSIDMDEKDVETMSHYTYCLNDDFTTDCVRKTYEYVKKQEKVQSWKNKIASSWKKALRYATKKKQSSSDLRFFSFYFWLVLLTMIPLTIVIRFRIGLASHMLHVIQTAAFAGLVSAEWIYLAINGRFPRRVEESMRIMMLTAALVMLCHFLESYKDVWMCRLHGILQIIIIIAVFPYISQMAGTTVAEVQGNQQYNQIYDAEKGEILNYCGEHPENYYILETRSFSKESLPSDNYHQMNWYMSGSWSAYSPLYDQKLKSDDIGSLGTAFLLQDNTYIITRGKKHIGKLLGKDEDDVEYEIVDEFCSNENNFFEIYKVTGVN